MYYNFRTFIISSFILLLSIASFQINAFQGKKNIDKKISWQVWHGALGEKSWKLPFCAAKTKKCNRKDQHNYTNASEYVDHPEVLDAKMKKIAELIKKSKFVITYAGAGLSRASGIPDYGTKAENSIMKEYSELKDPYCARPTYAHYVLTILQKAGCLHYFVQQNHDGLPQKAGFPQDKINEIHGALFDPSNPVVQFDESLRLDLSNAMYEAENKTDLCLCMGTSLSGMSADSCVKIPCKKFQKKVKGCNGSVIFNLQFTPADKPGVVSIRVWGKIDDAMKLLLKHLGLKFKKPKIAVQKDIVSVPYDKVGIYDETKKQVLNLSVGEKIIICHSLAKYKGLVGQILGRDAGGNYKIKFENGIARFGSWWPNALKNGEAKEMPIRNLNPKFK